MSLVIAKQDKNGIYLIGDTKLMYADIAAHPEQKVASPEDGVIKVSVIHPSFCICFAGDVAGVDHLMEFCRNVVDFNRILSELFAFHKKCNGQTEFLVAVSHHPFYRIFEIKDMEQHCAKSAWIGSRLAFSEFQKYMAERRTVHPTTALDFNMSEAFRMVMESSMENSVNGFQISVANLNGYFTYQNRMQMAIPSQTLPARYSILTHGSAQKGGYSVHFFPSNPTFTVLPVHVLQGNFGIIYKATNGGLLWPEVVPNISEREFARLTMLKYGISPPAFGPEPGAL